MKVCGIVLACLLVASSVRASERKTFQIYPGVDACNGQWRDVSGAWSNQTGHPIYIKEIRWWMGASLGLVADIVGALYLSHSDVDFDLILSSGWDRYRPDMGHFDAIPTVLAPDSITMLPNEWLTVIRRCTPMPSNTVKGPEVLQVVRIWYTDEP